MKIDIKETRKALKLLSNTVEKRNTIPVLGCLHFSPNGEFATLTTTNLDVEQSIIVPIGGKATKPFCVDFYRFKSTIDNCGEKVNISIKDNSLTIEGDYFEVILPTMAAGDFPFMKFKKQKTITVGSGSLREQIGIVSHAICDMETRYYLNGIYFECVDGRLRAVTTDGHRLAMHDGDEVSEFEGFIFPRGAVSVVYGALKSTQSNSVDILIDGIKGKIELSSNHSVTCKFIDGTFPDYRRVIPNRDEFISIDRAEMSSAVRRVSALSRQKHKSVRFAPNGTRLYVEMQDYEGCSAKSSVSLVGKMPDFEWGVNASHFLDALKILPVGDVSFGMEDNSSPIVIKSSQMPDTTQVIMPLRV